MCPNKTADTHTSEEDIDSSESGEDVYEVEKIVDTRCDYEGGPTMYRVRWVGWDSESDTWEPYENLLSCKDLVEEYEGKQRRRKRKYMQKADIMSDEDSCDNRSRGSNDTEAESAYKLGSDVCERVKLRGARSKVYSVKDKKESSTNKKLKEKEYLEPPSSKNTCGLDEDLFKSNDGTLVEQSPVSTFTPRKLDSSLEEGELVDTFDEHLKKVETVSEQKPGLETEIKSDLSSSDYDLPFINIRKVNIDLQLQTPVEKFPVQDTSSPESFLGKCKVTLKRTNIPSNASVSLKSVIKTEDLLTPSTNSEPDLPDFISKSRPAKAADFLSSIAKCSVDIKKCPESPNIDLPINMRQSSTNSAESADKGITKSVISNDKLNNKTEQPHKVNLHEGCTKPLGTDSLEKYNSQCENYARSLEDVTRFCADVISSSKCKPESVINSRELSVVVEPVDFKNATPSFKEKPVVGGSGKVQLLPENLSSKLDHLGVQTELQDGCVKSRYADASDLSADVEKSCSKTAEADVAKNSHTTQENCGKLLENTDIIMGFMDKADNVISSQELPVVADSAKVQQQPKKEILKSFGDEVSSAIEPSVISYDTTIHGDATETAKIQNFARERCRNSFDELAPMLNSEFVDTSNDGNLKLATTTKIETSNKTQNDKSLTSSESSGSIWTTLSKSLSHTQALSSSCNEKQNGCQPGRKCSDLEEDDDTTIRKNDSSENVAEKLNKGKDKNRDITGNSSNKENTSNKQFEENYKSHPQTKKTHLHSHTGLETQKKSDFDFHDEKDLIRVPSLPLSNARKCDISPEEFRQAVKDGDYSKVLQALRTSCAYNLNECTGAGMTLLMMAAVSGFEDICEILVLNGARINTQQKNGMTALIHAAEQGHSCVVGILIEMGAHLNLVTSTGETALMKACKKGHVAVVSRLLSFGANYSLFSPNGFAALQIANSNGHIECVKCIESHDKRLKTAFFRVIEHTLNNNATIENEIFPVQCFALNESTTCEIEFSWQPQEKPQEKICSLLFIAYAKITFAEMLCRMHGACAVQSVLLNGIQQPALTEHGKFVLSFCPFKKGKNKLSIQTLPAPNCEAKLLVSACRVVINVNDT